MHEGLGVELKFNFNSPLSLRLRRSDMMLQGGFGDFYYSMVLEGGRGKGGYWTDVGGSIESKRNELALGRNSAKI